MNRLIILVLLLIPIALALPTLPEPPLTGNDTTIEDVFVFMDFDNYTMSPFDVVFGHTSNETYGYCALMIGTDFIHTGLYNLSPEETVTVTVDKAPGNYILTGMCAQNPTLNPFISQDRAFTVYSDVMLNITKPLNSAELSNKDVVVVLNHTATGLRVCNVTLTDDPASTFYDSKEFNLLGGSRKIVTFNSLPDDDYMLRAWCSLSDFTGSFNSTKVKFSVDNTTNSGSSGGDYAVVLMDPDEDTLYDSDVYIRYFHNFTSRADCNLSIDGVRNKTEDNLLYNVLKSYTIDMAQGDYKLNITCENSTFSAFLIYEFEVDLNETTNSTNSTNTTGPVISLVGYTVVKPNVTEGDPVIVAGAQFTPGDLVKVWVTGGGKSYTNTSTISSTGTFAITYNDALAPANYNVIARNQNDSTEFASMSFIVVEDTVTTSGSNNNTNNNSGSWTKKNDSSGGSNLGSGSGGSGDTNFPTGGSDPFIEEPNIVDDEFDDGGSGWLIWVLIPFIAFLVVVGGLLGFLVYRGDLDISSMDAFQSSFENLIGSSTGVGATPTVMLDSSEANTIKNFVNAEREKGFDDLTIRSSLLARGWDKSHVDKVFDDLYKGAQ